MTRSTWLGLFLIAAGLAVAGMLGAGALSERDGEAATYGGVAPACSARA